MSEKRDLPYLTSTGSSPQGDAFLAVVDRLESEANLAELLDRAVRMKRAHAVREARADEQTGFEALVDTLRGKLELPRPAAVLTALRNAELRTAFLAEVGALTAAEVARLAGSRARNSSALAGRWRAEGRVFALPWGGELMYPTFQFRDGVPRPGVGRVLAALGDRLGPWEVALWFATPSAYLPDEARPMDRLDDAETLVQAARAELELPAF